MARGELETFQLEYRILRHDKTRIWAHLTVSLIRNAQGEPDYCLGVMEDISDRKRSQLQIQGLNARLRRAMTETHHRVKNNLQQITAMIELADNDEAFVPISKLKHLKRAVKTMALVHDLLTERAKEDMEANWLNVGEMLEQLANLLRETAPERRIVVSLDEARLQTDKATALALVANELVSNALKHSAGTVEMVFEAGETAAKLAVRDDGPGFSPDFNPRKAAHTGLELMDSLTRHDLGGTARFCNRPEGGGEVEIDFPLTALPSRRRIDVLQKPLAARHLIRLERRL